MDSVFKNVLTTVFERFFSFISSLYLDTLIQCPSPKQNLKEIYIVTFHYLHIEDSFKPKIYIHMKIFIYKGN